MHGKITIRKMKIEDYEKVIKLWTSVEGVALSDADEKEEISLFLNRNSGLSFVAEGDDKVIGAILCGHDGRRGYLHHLAVDAQYRGNKIGRNLVEHCLIKLKEEGIRKCHLFVFANNQQGMNFWSHIGFHKREDINIFSMNV
ncbi:MAG: GNAT family N-acetyltransferase [Sporomusaceae bacterium]|nr:GNAT family N-acetyltransferase [Sporomusaceae bacterium]